MYSPTLLEKIAEGRHNDRLREAEKARLLQQLEDKSGRRLALVFSGAALAILMISQLF